MGISQASYSTTRVMRRDPTSPSADVPAPIPIGGSKFYGAIEILAADVQAHFRSKDYRFPVARDVAENGLAEDLSRALELVALVPSLYSSVCQLIRCVHLLQSNAEDCDISFSDPGLPFSIFVSVPGRDSCSASFRLAEAIIHESMHLQLSLLERITPIAHSQTSKYYSPWKRSNRDASGVLHALYVFTAIAAWLERLPLSANNYSSVRRDEIVMQVAEITPFESAELTEVGDALRRYLFSQH